jgi:serine/threonine-protein phosphatase 2A activator
MSYDAPQKRILTPEQLVAFQSSQTHQDIVSYIETLNESVVGIKLSDECSQSMVRCQPYRHRSLRELTHLCSALVQGVKAILGILDRVDTIARDTPPIDNAGSRFGNPAFRQFYDKLCEVCKSRL